MSDISPHCSWASSAQFLWIFRGPSLFLPFNLLAATRSRFPHHDHTLAQINIGKRGTHTNTHTDWYGADGAAQLMEGEKLWLMAPPHHAAAFNALFPQTKHFNLAPTNADPKVAERFEALYALSGSCAVHQRTGDIIYVPGGWPHAVINLTDAVSIGWSYLRPWKLKGCLEWAREQGPEKTASVADLAAVFETTLATALPGSINPLPELPFLGISAKEIQELRATWNALTLTWRTSKRAADAEQALIQSLTQLHNSKLSDQASTSASTSAARSAARSAASNK